MTTSRPFRYDEGQVLARTLRRGRRRLFVVGGVIATVLAVVTVAFWSDPSWRTVGPGLILFMVALYGGVFVQARATIRKRLRDPRNGFGKSRQVLFDEETIVIRDEGGSEGWIPWAQVVGRERDRETTLVWFTTAQALFVPDSAWIDPDLELWRKRVGRLPEFKPWAG